MNWLQKISQMDDETYETFGDPKEWQPGTLAILSHFGWRDISVVKILQWEDVVNNHDSEGYFENVDDNSIQTTRGFGNSWKRGESVPCVTISAYSDTESGESRYDKVGKVHLVAASNLYRTFEDIVKKESRVIYPDLILGLLSKSHVGQLQRDYPQLMGTSDFGDMVDYDTYEVSGHQVMVFMDKARMAKNPGILQTRGTDGIFYWQIPALKVRSVDNPSSREGLDTRPWGGGTYPTKQRALESAENYINYLFYGEEIPA